jgi:hypothetical protein
MKSQKKERQGSPSLRENSGYGGEDSLIRMDIQRSRRFWREFGLLMDDLESLAAIGKNFPIIDIGVGDISPKSVVDAFTVAMRERMELLYAMIHCEEHTVPEFAENGGNE